MANELKLALTLNYLKSGVVLQRSLSDQFNVAGSTAIQNVASIGTSDESLALGDVATNGYLLLHNLEAYVEVTTPAAPTVTPAGTTGASTWSYKIVAKQSDGSYSAASSAGTTTTGNATLTALNKNVITWAAITGAATYDIYRTAHGTSPSTDGKIGNTALLTLDDTGLAGDAGTAPATGTDNVILLGADGSSYPIKLKGEDFALLRFNGAAAHAKANTIASKLEYILISD
jgi:hypothetical protein